MGCGQSKIEHEEAVTRCKERKLYMKESVSARNAFAAAHSAYVMSLKNTGAALSDYAHGEVLQPPGSKPYSPLHDSASAASNGTAKTLIGGGVVAASAAPESLPPPPPPLPVDSTLPPPPLQRAASMPEFKVTTKVPMHEETILEEENEEEADAESNLKRRSSSHKRSGSSKNASGSSKNNMNVDDGDRVAPPPEPNEWDYFFPGIDNMPGTTLTEVVEENDVMPPPRRVNDVSNKNMNADDVGAVDKKGMVYEEMSNKGGVVDDVEEKVGGEVVVKNAKKGKVVGGGGGGGGMGGGMMEGRRAAAGGGGGGKVLSNANLLQIFTDLDDHFLKASESAHEVSKMLEATRLHYHSNFADNRGDLTFLLCFC